MDGDATLLRGDAQADDDADDAGRDTGEDCTTFYSRRPVAADAQIPGPPVASKPLTGRPPHPPPRKLGDALSGVPVEVHTSSATRTADAFRAEDLRRTRIDLGPAAARGRVPRPAPRIPQNEGETS
jgi:hypothetical protein